MANTELGFVTTNWQKNLLLPAQPAAIALAGRRAHRLNGRLIDLIDAGI